MGPNPLQQYFRQPKIYISLPSGGVYNKPGTVDGDIANLPVFGMTGMDELLMKTPDALLSGESTVKVMQSCCPAIKDAWEISMMDANMIFTAIKIATFGNKLNVGHICPNCGADNEYAIELDGIVEYYSKLTYNSKLTLDNMVVKTQPLSYKQSTKFNLKTFELQQQLRQVQQLENEDEKQMAFRQLFVTLADVQQELYLDSIESVQISDQVVTEREYIAEWLNNCDKTVYDQIRDHVDANRQAQISPPHPVKCSECESENTITIELDQTNFFENA